MFIMIFRKIRHKSTLSRCLKLSPTSGPAHSTGLHLREAPEGHRLYRGRRRELPRSRKPRRIGRRVSPVGLAATLIRARRRQGAQPGTVGGKQFLQVWWCL